MPTKISTITVNELGYGAAAAASAAAAAASEAAAATYADVAWPGQVPGNRIINGNFDIWQRGTSFDVSGTSAYTADRWRGYGDNGTHTVSRQFVALGTLFGAAQSRYVLRSAQSSFNATTGAGVVGTFIEEVRSYAGQTITVLGWARRVSGSGNLQLEYAQVFGSGGSADVRAKAGDITLTASWAPFALTINVPPISGKTIGDGGHLALFFYGNAGSGIVGVTAGGVTAVQQDITFELGGIHILPGTHTTSAADNYPGTLVADELARCQRYYVSLSSLSFSGYNTAGNPLQTPVVFPSTMRASPSVTLSSTTYSNGSGATTTGTTADSTTLVFTATASAYARVTTDIALDAEL